MSMSGNRVSPGWAQTDVSTVLGGAASEQKRMGRGGFSNGSAVSWENPADVAPRASSVALVFSRSALELGG